MLLGHVVAGRTLGGDLANDQLLPTLGGGSLRVNVYSPLPNYQVSFVQLIIHSFK